MKIKYLAKHDHRECKRYLKSIDTALSERVLDIVKEANFITALMDGSQARKTKVEKELIMVRCHHRGKD